MLSKHFKREEFACHDACGFDTVDSELLAVLEDVRAFFDAPVIVTSGCRCRVQNEKIHGSKNSQHVFGKAADIKVMAVPSSDVAHYLERKYPDRYGIGRYKTWTHIDVRSGPARWDKTG
ncbi:D-Ala-D-Ala carboxypeptidase family metallohydrolase [Thermodesulfobacteriota bacterium]